jgi:hypothetical protein
LRDVSGLRGRCNKLLPIAGFPNPTNYNPCDWIMAVALTHSIKDLDKVGFFLVLDDYNLGEVFREVDENSSYQDVLGITGHQVDADISQPGDCTQIQLLFKLKFRSLVCATSSCSE